MVNVGQLLEMFAKISQSDISNLRISIYNNNGGVSLVDSVHGLVCGNNYKIYLGGGSYDLCFHDYVDDLDHDAEVEYISRVIRSNLGKSTDDENLLVVRSTGGIVCMDKNIKVVFVNKDLIGSVVFSYGDKLVKVIGACLNDRGHVITTATAYDVRGSTERLPYPEWLNRVTSHIDIFRNPSNKANWYIINYKESESNYAGRNIFIIPSIGAMIFIEGLWVGVDLGWFDKFGESMQGEIGEEIRLYKGISEV